MSLDLDQFHATFFEESREGLEAMEAGLLSLEQGNRDGDLINSIFRAAHSIKGGSATFGFDAIAGMTHVLETLLDELRAGQRAVSPPAVDAMLASVDVLRALLAEAEHGTPADPAAVQAMKDRLNAVLSGQDAPAAAASPAAAESSAGSAAASVPSSSCGPSAPSSEPRSSASSSESSESSESSARSNTTTASSSSTSPDASARSAAEYGASSAAAISG